MQDFRIEKDVPLPVKRGRNLSQLTLTLIAMKKGESIYLYEPAKAERLKLYNSLYTTGKRHGVTIASRSYDDGIRIWRT